MCGFGEWFCGDWCNWKKKNKTEVSIRTLIHRRMDHCSYAIIAKIWSFIPLSILNNNPPSESLEPHPPHPHPFLMPADKAILLWHSLNIFCFVQTSCEHSHAWFWLNLNRNQGHRSTATMLWVSKYLMWVCSTVYTELAYYCKDKMTSFLISLITTLPSSLPQWLLLRTNKREPEKRLTHMHGES